MSLSFYLDMQRCIGCAACQVACKDRFDLQSAGPLLRKAKRFESGSFPSAVMYNVSVACNHCESPACVANCPTGAMFKSEDGTVQHDDATCIGCKTCAAACPYEAPQFDGRGSVAIKCDSCGALRASGMNPVCVDACSMRALDFGEADDLRAKYGDDLASEVPGLPSAATATPNLLIRVKEIPSADVFREIVL